MKKGNKAPAPAPVTISQQAWDLQLKQVYQNPGFRKLRRFRSQVRLTAESLSYQTKRGWFMDVHHCLCFVFCVISDAQTTHSG